MSTSLFARELQDRGYTLRRTRLRVLQVNVGKLCNQACTHCHVDAGPKRTEVMSRETAAEVVAAVRRLRPETVDLTGGAPELNPHFRTLVLESRAVGCRVMDRCNLTVLSVAGQEDLADFLAENEVEVVASLPCYLEDNVDLQRGRGVFAQSLVGLRRLNHLGYGRDDGELVLNLVYNPVGTHLPPAQEALEADYRRELWNRYQVRFNRLYTLANMPISRFAHGLRRDGRYQTYLRMLADSFNAATLDGLMCRDTVSVGWDGRLYDCDFNQMLEQPLAAPYRHVRDPFREELETAPIALADHCFGCTAGAGSSCGGSLVQIT